MKTNARTLVSQLTKTRRIPRIIYNDDTCTLRTAPPPHSLESLSCALDYLKGTQVDCLCWCIGECIAYAWPSKVIDNIFDMYDRGLKHISWAKLDRDVMYGLHCQGADYLPHFIERARAQGLMFIASFRMNDTHIKSYPNSVLAPEFWKKHQEWRIWGATDGKSYYNAAMDYSFAPVRNRYRDAILEVAEKYDVDGIELDFTRTPYLFQPHEAWEKRGILTQFVREIREKLERIGKRRKKPFVMVLRIPSRDRVLKGGGIDAEQWIKQRLADILVMSEMVVNLNHRIEPWRTLCRRHGVLLYPAIEVASAFNPVEFFSPLVQCPTYPRHDGWAAPSTEEQELRIQRAAAQNFLSQDPDGIYMFNFPCRLAEGKNIMHTDRKAFERVTSVLHELGDEKTLAGKPRFYTFYQDLPIYVEANRPRQYYQTIEFDMRGKDLRDATVKLRYRQIAERNPHADGEFEQDPIVKRGMLKVYLNDREILERDLKKTRAPAGRIPSGFTIGQHQIVELRIDGDKLRDGTNTLSFEMPKFPHEEDPYIYIYALEAQVDFNKNRR